MKNHFMNKNWVAKLIAILMVVTLFVPVFGTAEELGEMDLFDPEIYAGETAVEAPEAPAEPTVEEAPSIEETPAAEDAPVEQAVAAPELVPMSALSIALTQKSAKAEMNVGDTIQIVVNEGETGTFVSKKAKIAIVDGNGLVTALAKGSAKIEFKPEGGKKRTLSIKVNDPYECKGISIAEGKTLTLNVGSAYQLTAILAPTTAQTTLTWSSGKTKVAVVDGNGMVTGLAEGKAKITVKTANKKKAKITVQVVDPYKPTGVKLLDGQGTELTVGEQLQLGAELVPSTAISNLIWQSSKPKVATVDEYGLVTAVGKGKAKITVTTVKNKKAKATFTVTVNGGVVDLTPLICKDIEYAKASIGGSWKRVSNNSPDPTVGYRNKKMGIYFGVAGEDGAPELVYEIDIENSNEYSVLGISKGMTIDAARQILLGQGWGEEDFSGDQYRCWNGDSSIIIRLDGSNIVVSIYADFREWLPWY